MASQSLGIRARFSYRIETIVGIVLTLLGIGFLIDVRVIAGLVWVYTGLFLIPRTRPLMSFNVFARRNAGFVASMVFFLLFIIALSMSV